jgi:integrase/recombinase XerD
MATLKKRRNKWYARIRIWANDIRKETEKQIPLKTKSKVTALERLSIVNKHEDDIKSGLSFTFPWEHIESHVKVDRFTINDAIKEWMAHRARIGIRPKTLELNQNGLSHFVNAVGAKCPLDVVDAKMIDNFVRSLTFLDLSINSINIHLRTVKSMMRYYWKRDVIARVPLIEELKKEEENPIYITDDEFQSIMELEWLDKFYKRVFYFYRDTGCRLREPFISRLDGEWLDIPNLSKGKRPRSIPLNESLRTIYLEIMDWHENGYGATLKDASIHISKKFKKSLRAIGSNESKKFHSLRHTFAVRRIVEQVPIFKIQKMMGHSSIVTTEGYLKLELKRLERDFPSIAYKLVRSVFRDTKIRDTDEEQFAFVEGNLIN